MTRKKLSQEEREEIAKEIITNFNSKNYTVDKLRRLSNKKPKNESLNSVTQKLLNYSIVIEHAVSWTYRKDYLNLLKDFVAKKIDGEAFCSEFLTLRNKNYYKVNQICKNIEEKTKSTINFHYSDKSENFYWVIDDLFFEIDRFNPNLEDSDLNEFVYSEKKLRSVIKENYKILQNVCELED